MQRLTAVHMNHRIAESTAQRVHFDVGDCQRGEMSCEIERLVCNLDASITPYFHGSNFRECRGEIRPREDGLELERCETGCDALKDRSGEQRSGNAEERVSAGLNKEQRENKYLRILTITKTNGEL